MTRLERGRWAVIIIIFVIPVLVLGLFSVGYVAHNQVLKISAGVLAFIDLVGYFVAAICL